MEVDQARKGMKATSADDKFRPAPEIPPGSRPRCSDNPLVINANVLPFTVDDDILQENRPVPLKQGILDSVERYVLPSQDRMVS
ncbi:MULTISPECIES: hypothetical protein [unclassified Methanoregula]|uniref:hypothetical protein n=1 Tax=unclassified Methanoregula TaxID=2649730 RepID=UPI0025D0CB80|nr:MULTISPECIES: hypothetical protein [unclassified Methanoregula]